MRMAVTGSLVTAGENQAPLTSDQGQDSKKRKAVVKKFLKEKKTKLEGRLVPTEDIVRNGDSNKVDIV